MSRRPALEFVGIELQSEDCPARLRRAIGSVAAKHLYAAGNLALLDGRVVGLLASREVEPTGLLKAAEAFKALIAAGVCVIGGWHSPLEATLLEAAEAAHASLGILLATGPEHAALPTRVLDRVKSGAAFALTHCGPKVRRLTRAAALRRNDLVIALSDALLVPVAPVGSATLGVARRAISAGKPVLTIDLAANAQVLAAGAQPFTRTALADALAKPMVDRA